MGFKENHSNVRLENVQDFEMMFERLKVNRPREAATYYTILIMDSPKEFSEMLRYASDLVNMTRRPLETGRSSLLKFGLIAEVLFAEDNNEFGRESFLPVHPEVIWLDVRDDLKKVVSSETFAGIEKRLSCYVDAYDDNYKTYGLKLRRHGNVTLRYSGRWVLYNILHNCMKQNDSLDIQIGGNRLFDDPYLGYFKRFLELNNNVRLIVDENINEKLVSDLIEEFGDKLDIRCFNEATAGTMRNYVFGKQLAINGIKILQENHCEPSYVGTAYVEPHEIEMLSCKFDDLWDLAQPVRKKKAS